MLNVKSTMQLYGVAQPKHDGSSIPVSAERTIDHDLNPDIEPNWSDAMSSVAALPSRQESAYLWEQMRANVSWQCNIHPDPSFISNLLHHCYSTPLEELSPRRLALLYMILAIGCYVDLNRPAESPDSEKYHMLARAALCEIPVLEDTTVETVTALYYELWFLLVFSDKKKSTDQAWALMGLTAKLAQSIGLHRNGVKSKVIPEEVENRRSTVLELDMQVRKFPIPEHLQRQNSQSRIMLLQQVSFTMAYESVLLQLHRTYFMRALSGPEEAFNKRHRYAPSVVAVWLGAVRMIAAVETLYRREPELAARILGYWSNTFSAVVAIALLVSRAPFTCLSPAGLQELQRARLLYQAVTHTRSSEIVPMLDIIIAKANNIFQRWYHGQDVPTLVLRHEDEHDTFIDQLIKMDSNPFVPAPSPPPTDDSFQHAHPLLTQCIAEAHERAKIMFPMRKPCQCSVGNPTTCPPSHSWTPPPHIDLSRPILPYLYAEIANPFVFDAAPAIPPITSHYTGSNSVNFELGALHPNTEQSWMGWF
ncbi:hypothetical protein HHX47_DHR4000200 [Lentinula edodes]|nr:hypothetical protein HHX47_DHR4000200 [Lentinula edodes]